MGNIKCYHKTIFTVCSSVDPGGGGGTGSPDPPGKSQVIWVSIGNKQLDPLEKVEPPPPHWKIYDPLWNLEK